jgi:hypothetical protein
MQQLLVQRQGSPQQLPCCLLLPERLLLMRRSPENSFKTLPEVGDVKPIRIGVFGDLVSFQ